MMSLKVTTRDRIFAAIAIPAAIVAAYAHFAHAPLARRIAAMRERLAELGDVSEIKAQRPGLERRRDEARALRDEAERANAGRMAAAGDDASGDDAGRLRRFAAILDEAGGLRVTATERLDDDDRASTDLPRRAAGVESPALWRFTIVSDYAGVLRALELAGQRAPNAIVEGVFLDGAAGRHAARAWKINVRL